MTPHIVIVDSDPSEINVAKRRDYSESTGEGFAAALAACDPSCCVQIVAPYDGEMLPGLSGTDGVVFTGSAVEWTTDDRRAAPLAEAMRAAFSAGVPVFGSCNGLQLAASVLGGASQPSPNGREDGLAKNIRLTLAGQSHALLQGRVDGFAAACVHRDEVVRVPAGAVILAGNDHSPVQAMAYEQDNVRFWGVQYHPEYEFSYIGKRVQEWQRLPDDIAEDIQVVDSDVDAAARLSVRIEDMQSHTRLTEIRNWLRSL